MQTPLNASASTAGALLSSSTFEIPPFQREYSWQDDEVSDFWNDLRSSLHSDAYFLGLVILTDEEEAERKHVVDGQQRLVTLTLLAAALYFEALQRGRGALADRIQADFLRSIDYASDDTDPRIVLSDKSDNKTLQTILDKGIAPKFLDDDNSVSFRISKSYNYLVQRLREDLKEDPFKRLGMWTEFLTHKVYFAVFIHPDSSAAYQVYEVINTRGRELTTADLLKNYILSQTPKYRREDRYKEWQSIANQFGNDGSNTFVQYIRHAVTVQSGHILPKDLFGFLAQRVDHSGKNPPNPDQLMDILDHHLSLYVQMIDPTLAGPADPESLKVFSALNSLSVIAVRPILLAISETPDALEGMKAVLRLVVRRIIVGNLGTGNVERRFGEVARKINQSRSWGVFSDELQDLNPSKDEFIEQMRKRSFNKGTLGFMRRSILAKTTTPDDAGVLHFIWTRQAAQMGGMSEEEGAFWAGTVGNTFLSQLERRPKGAIDWDGFKHHMLPHAVAGEWTGRLATIDEWDVNEVEDLGTDLAEAAGDVWY